MTIIKNQIRKLIIETIGDIEEEYKYFGEKLVDGLRNDPAFSTPIDLISDDCFDRPEYFKNEYGLVEIGRGFFRRVYKTEDPNILLKFATSNESDINGSRLKAVNANLQEVKRFNMYPEFFPKSYAYDPQGVWLLVETVPNIANTQQEFKDIIKNNFQCIGGLSKNISLSISSVLEQISDETDRIITNENLDLVKECAQEELNIFGIQGVFFDILKEAIENNDFIGTLYSFINNRINSICKEIIIQFSRKNRDDLQNPIYELKNQRARNIIADRTFNLCYKDTKFKRFYDMLYFEKIPLREVCPGNTGTDANGNFKIIDATIL